MENISSLRRALARAVDKLNDPATIASAGRYEAQEVEVRRLERQVSDAEARIRARAREVANAGNAGVNTEERFPNLGEQLLAVARASTGGGMDMRLRAPLGMNEGNPADGGFAVQVDFATTLVNRIYEGGEVASRVTRFPISPNSNGMKIPAVDETSRATGSRYGGVQVYWVGEGVAPPATRPKFRTVDLDLKKLMGLFYATDEMMQDAAFLTAMAEAMFYSEAIFALEDSIVRGSGVAQPKGFLATGPKVTVAKETSQAADTILFKNVLKMWARLDPRSQGNAVWYINQDVVPELLSLNGPAGATVPTLVYMPPGGLSAAPYGTILGRPVVPIEYCATVGDEGDIILADLSQYVVVDKGGVDQQSSIHVSFTTAETAFRIQYRVDGQPMWTSPLTPYKGTATVSPFVTLAERA